jgi:ABC-type multidrug transport system ATPase subunit
MGMLPPDDGTIDLLGHRVPDDVVPALARVGYVPERLHLYPGALGRRDDAIPRGLLSSLGRARG